METKVVMEMRRRAQIALVRSTGTSTGGLVAELDKERMV